MSAPLIFNGRRAKMLTQDGILRADGSIIDNNGIVNLIKNGHAEVNTTGWTVSKNTSAASRPDSGFVTSSTNITWTRNTTNPIDGQADFLYTKDAADRQGEQVYYGFTVSKKHRAKVMQIEVDYMVNSGTFSAGSSSTDSDVIVYIYDVTNSTFIEPYSIKLLSNSSTLTDKFIANFQTSATGSSYRILFHQATTSASAFAVQFKEVKIFPSQYVYGTLITDWVSYTPTGSWVTNTTYTGRWRRVGDTLESQINLVLAGAPTAADLTVNFLPSGLTVDSAKMAAFSFGSIGDANIIDSGSRVYIANPAYNGGSSVYIVHTESGNTGIVNATNPTTFASADNVRMNIRAPITGWSSSTQQSDGYDGREISLRATNNSSTTIATSGDTLIPYTLGNGVTYDKVNGLSSSIYTVPSSGRYKITAKIFTAASQSWTNGDAINLFAMVDNSTYHILGSYIAQVTQTVTNQFAIGGSTTVDLVAGQNIRIKANAILAATKATAASLPNYNSLEIEKLQAPTTISATEVVAASYTTAAGQSISNSTTDIIDFGTKDFDTHNAVTTGSSWKFTAPISGLYEVSSTILFASSAVTQGNAIDLQVFKNGTVAKRLGYKTIETTFSNFIGHQGSAMVQLNAGDYIDVRVGFNRTGGNTNLHNSASYNHVSIHRIK